MESTNVWRVDCVIPSFYYHARHIFVSVMISTFVNRLILSYHLPNIWGQAFEFTIIFTTRCWALGCLSASYSPCYHRLCWKPVYGIHNHNVSTNLYTDIAIWRSLARKVLAYGLVDTYCILAKTTISWRIVIGNPCFGLLSSSGVVKWLISSNAWPWLQS